MPFSGFQDFNPDFRRALQPFLDARPGISINSGYRTPQRQAELFAQALAKYGSVQEARIHVAPAPGTYGSQGSRHNFGLAADLAYATPEDKAWALANAKNYGLNFRMASYEPWHIELIGGKPQAVANNVPPVNPVSDPYQLPSRDQLANDTVDPPAMAITGVQRPNRQTADASLEQYQPTDWQSFTKLLSPNRSEASQKLLNRLRAYT